MSSDVPTLLDTPAPRRPYKVIVFLDRDTLRLLERSRGPAGRRRSKSEAAYLLMLAGIEAEKAALAANDEPTSGDTGWAGEERRATA